MFDVVMSPVRDFGPGGVIAGNLMPSGTTYTFDDNSLISVIEKDVSTLLTLGLVVGKSSGAPLVVSSLTIGGYTFFVDSHGSLVIRAPDGTLIPLVINTLGFAAEGSSFQSALTRRKPIRELWSKVTGRSRASTPSSTSAR